MCVFPLYKVFFTFFLFSKSGKYQNSLSFLNICSHQISELVKWGGNLTFLNDKSLI